jgi:hypothetical protein
MEKKRIVKYRITENKLMPSDLFVCVFFVLTMMFWIAGLIITAHLVILLSLQAVTAAVFLILVFFPKIVDEYKEEIK